jgi:radical SAM superfamily enzyme YgiQ (UPF0313 family)
MKIGLIAMSGIRACDPELLRLGLTLPGFVERSKVIASLPSLGLLTLAALTPKRHQVEYLEVPDVGGGEVVPGRFDLVGISTYSAQVEEAYALADRYRATGALVVMGGPHVSVLPAEALEHCTSVVVGHGELHWPAVVADAEAGHLHSVYGSLEDDYDFRDAPMPAFELLDIERYNRLTIQTSRGCSHKCEFCAGSIVFCHRYRQKPAAKVLAEIDRICALWSRPFIELADDNSFVSRSYWLELLPEIARRNIRWFTETDISVGEDDELLELLERSGCVELLIGLESPVREGLEAMEPGVNWKLSQFHRYRDSLRNIQNHGVRVNACFILGLDGQTPEIFDQVREFVREADLFDVQITIQTPFPGTPLFARLEREGRLLQKGAWGRCTLFDVNFLPAAMSVEQLQQGFRNLGVDLYSSEWTHARRKRFVRSLRAHRNVERSTAS